MARPLLEARHAGDGPSERVQHWADWPGALGDKRRASETLSGEQLRSLTRGKREDKHRPAGDKPGHVDDSLHLLVMDLHKQLYQ